jgi:hypothetical protein
MAADVLDRLRRERPAAEPADAGDPADAGALFAQIVAVRRDANAPRAPRFPRRRLALVLLAALAIAAPLAIAARTTHVLDFALGDPPPTPVVQFLDGMLQPAYGPKEGPPQNGPTRQDIVKGSERVVAEVRLRTGKTARLYAVDVRTGGQCFAAIGGPFDGGSCVPGPSKWRYPVAAAAQMGGAGRAGTFAKNPVLYGRITKIGATSLVARYADLSSDVIPTRNGWFLFEVPKAHWLRGHEPLRLDVLDGSGRVVGSMKDPFGLHPPTSPKPEHPSGVQRVLARESLGWKGAILELQSAAGDRGHRCVRVVNAHSTNTGGWMCGAVVAQTAPVSEGQTTTPPPVYFELHQLVRGATPGGYVYARGWVGPHVASLEIRFQDSTVAPIPLHDRLFIYVVPEAHWALGTRPSYVIARDRSGRAIFRRFLYPAAPCAYPLGEKSCAGRFITNG